MTESQPVQNQTRQDVQNAFVGGDVRTLVRDITLRALTKRSLDRDSMRAVIESVTQGVVEGAERHPVQLELNLRQAMAGLDDALGKSAEAAKLATQEAGGKANHYAEHDLKNFAQSLETLETLFLETVTDVAKQTNQVAGDILRDIVSHLSHSGSEVGARSKEAVVAVRSNIVKTGRDSMAQARGTGKAVGQQLALVASGILAGMAEALHSVAAPPKPKP